MTRLHPVIGSAAACVFTLLASRAVATPFTLDDVDFWAGTGANHAVLIIDWADNATEPPALAWGYRWDGTAYGGDMLTAIVAADERLYAKLGGSPGSPTAVYGFGYDANDDGDLALDGGPEFDADGFVYTGPADGNESVDSADYYAEGWFTGFWHYGQADVNPYAGGSWESVLSGMAGRVLSDGSWDSWTFSPTFNFSAYAQNSSAAASPYPPGDFDRDRSVTAADYSVWKTAFGSTTETAADANHNGVVDAADYTIWRNHLGSGGDASAALATGVPEPSTFGLAWCAVFYSLLTTRRKGSFS